MNSLNKTFGRHGRGFTLIELLVVIAIMAILATLVVGVGSYVRAKGLEDETRGRMRIIMVSIEAYRDARGTYPVPNADPNALLDDETIPSDLYKALTGLTVSRDALKELPTDAIGTSKTDAELVFFDAFGVMMAYKPKGGPGGTPVLISAGPDGDFAGQSDNIRSDDK
jgi:prepilin-type N-terminal cleavage/methylation domain-containing protein